MRWAASYKSKSDIIFRPRSVQVEIGDETTLTLRTKKEKKFSGQNDLDRWVLPPTAPPQPPPQGRCAWRSEGLGWPQSTPLPHLCDRPGGQEGRCPGFPPGGPVGTQGWGPGSRPALLASPPVLQPNQEGVKHIKDPLNTFIGSVSGALNQILFFKSIWADGLKQGLDQRSEAQGSRSLCAEPSLSVPCRSQLEIRVEAQGVFETPAEMCP